MYIKSYDQTLYILIHKTENRILNKKNSINRREISKEKFQVFVCHQHLLASKIQILISMPSSTFPN
jgi:hypothetical protein